MDSQTSPHPNLWKLWICCSIYVCHMAVRHMLWHVRLQVEVRLLISCPQDREIILHYLVGPVWCQTSLKSGRGRLKERIRGRYNYERKAQRNATLLALQMEEETISQGMWGGLWKLETQEKESPLQPSEKKVALPISWL